MSQFETKIRELQKSISKGKSKIARKERCIPTMLIAGIAAPILAWLLLYFIQPRFVQEKEGAKSIRSNTKVFYWTVLFTVLIWVGMYLWTWCQGFDKIAMLCSKR